MKDLVIVGVGETAALAFEYFTHDSTYSVAAFSVEREYLSADTFMGLPIIALEEIEQRYPADQYEIFVALSSTQLNRPRARLFRAVKAKGYKCASYLSSRAFVWHNVQIGENCFVFENNTIQPFVRIENNVTLWSGNHIGHRTVIRENCFVSSHVVISGFCDIGENCFLGVNSTIINNITLGKDCFIGAGALIQKSVDAGRVYQAESTMPSSVGSLRLFKIREE
jgi:sugar O-acyltransferase (sialic acid O-acetyltransferase NeuD family)